MSECAVLGPVDPQLGQSPAASVLNAVSRKPVERVRDDTLIIADQAGKAISQLYEALKELLAPKCVPERVEELARLLSQGAWTHDYPITFEAAKSFGLPCDRNPCAGSPRKSTCPNADGLKVSIESNSGPRKGAEPALADLHACAL